MGRRHAGSDGIQAPTLPARPLPLVPGTPDLIATPSPNPPPVVSPSARPRLWPPDLTGFWEAPPRGPNVNAPLLVQINQAGGAVVLWFTRPPPGVEGVEPVLLPDLKANTPTTAWAYGVASAFVRDVDGADCLSRGADLSWMAVRTPVADEFNVLDPSHLYRPPPLLKVLEGNGKLSIDGQRLTLSFDGGRSPMMLTRVRPGARLPRAVIDELAEPLRTLMLIDSVRPLPSTLERRLLSLFAPEWADGEPRLAAHLRAWMHAPASPPAQRDVIRSQIADELSFGCAEPWRAALLDRMALAARTNPLTVDDATRSYTDWLTAVLDDEEQAARPQRKEESQRVQDAIRALGTGLESFAYTLKFWDLGAKSTSPGVGLGSFGVRVSVTKEALELDRDISGKVKYEESGRPAVKNRKPVAWRGTSDALFGAFGRIDGGLALKDFDPPDPSKPTLSEATADLGTVEFRSTLDLAGTDAFHGAIFTVASVVVGQGKFGNWIKAQLIDSSLWELRLASGGRMSAIVESKPFKGPSIANLSSMATRSWWKNWKPDKIELTIGRISLSVGFLSSLAGTPSRDRRPVMQRDRSAPVTAELGTFFEYDSTLLEDPRRPETRVVGRRLRLEERIAEIRGLLALPGPPVLLVGLTSPEGTDDYNLALSHNRALAIEQAMRDALGPIYARPPVTLKPLGEAPSRAGAGVRTVANVAVHGGDLPDPETWPSRAAYLNSPEGKRAVEWPQWRRVDVHVEGRLLIRVFTKDQPAGP